MTIERVMVAGGGTLGSQIAYQTAFKGIPVTIYDINETAITAAKNRVAIWDRAYQHDIEATPADIEMTHRCLSYSTDLATAVANADLVIEAIPEIVHVKNDFYAALARVAPAKTIFVTNTSTYLPSDFAAVSGRPEKFLALHFANHIWVNTIAEVMGHAGTSAAAYNTVVDFATYIGMVTIQLKKEQSGYVINSLLVPFLAAGAQLWAKGVADPETVDRTWMIATHSPLGPFAIFDAVGLRTAYNILMDLGKRTEHPGIIMAAEKLQHDLLDQGKLGQESGTGFYTYPNPAYKQPDFLAGKQLDLNGKEMDLMTE